MKTKEKLPGLSAQEISSLKEIIGDKYEAFVFGSRVTGKHKPFSDVDICLKGKTKITDEELAMLKISFQDSDFPYKVDLVDEASIAEDFKKLIAGSSVKI